MDQMVGRGPARDTDGDALKLWLRLFATANAVETELSRRLRAEFGMTLPRFDLMAQLAKAGDDVTLGDLSRRLMVTNGNVTGLVDRLLADKLVERRAKEGDRRSATVSLTEDGERLFAEMARVHRTWIEEIFDGLSAEERSALSGLLRTARDTVMAKA